MTEKKQKTAVDLLTERTSLSRDELIDRMLCAFFAENWVPSGEALAGASGQVVVTP